MSVELVYIDNEILIIWEKLKVSVNDIVLDLDIEYDEIDEFFDVDYDVHNALFVYEIGPFTATLKVPNDKWHIIK